MNDQISHQRQICKKNKLVENAGKLISILATSKFYGHDSLTKKVHCTKCNQGTSIRM